MTSPDKLALASRAEQAGGPDRELDREIHYIHHPTYTLNGNNFCEGYGFAKPYTASLDAITALITEKLPGAHWKVFTDEGRFDAAVNLWEPDNYCANPALALCAAFLRALASTEDQP